MSEPMVGFSFFAWKNFELAYKIEFKFPAKIYFSNTYLFQKLPITEGFIFSYHPWLSLEWVQWVQLHPSIFRKAQMHPSILRKKSIVKLTKGNLELFSKLVVAIGPLPSSKSTGAIGPVKLSG